MSQVYGLTALGNINDLITPTETSEYRLGDIIVIEEKESIRPNVLAEYMYVQNVLASPVLFAPYLIFPTEIIEEEVVFNVAIGAVATTFPIHQIAVPQVVFEENFYGFVKIKGVATVLLNGNSVNIAVGDALKLIQNTIFLVKNADTIQASPGLALEAVTADDTEALVLLNGNRISIPSS